MRYAIAALLYSAGAFAAQAAIDTPRAEAVIARCISIYHEPVDGKSHTCACPFDHARDGSLCGARSAHDRPGGASPVCLVNEVTPELLSDIRTNEQAILRERCHYHGR